MFKEYIFCGPPITDNITFLLQPRNVGLTYRPTRSWLRTGLMVAQTRKVQPVVFHHSFGLDRSVCSDSARDGNFRISKAYFNNYKI
jgi:hypothetical protein